MLEFFEKYMNTLIGLIGMIFITIGFEINSLASVGIFLVFACFSLSVKEINEKQKILEKQILNLDRQ